MPKNPPAGMPRVSPYLFYLDVEYAMQWLEGTCGFSRGNEIRDPDGAIMHAEMKYMDGVIMMGPPCDEQNTKSPKDLSGINQSLYIYVDDVDEHFLNAKGSGAMQITEPVDMFWGDRMYTIQDPEGHHWAFAQHIEDIAPEDMKPIFP